MRVEMPNIYDFNDELMAHEASSATFQYVAQRIGIVVMDNKTDDEVLAIWIYQSEQPDGSFKMQQISCRSHSAGSAIIGVLKSIEQMGMSAKLTIRLVGYGRAEKIVKKKLGQ